MNTKEFVEILVLLQDPRKTVTKLIDARQTITVKSIDARQTGAACNSRAKHAAPTGPGWLARFTVKTGDNGLLTVIRQLVNSNIADQSTRLTNTLIQRKVNYMKQNFRRGYLSLIV